VKTWFWKAIRISPEMKSRAASFEPSIRQSERASGRISLSRISA